MAYKLIITEHADELLNSLLYHLIYRLKNQQAAKHLPDEIDKIYTCLEKTTAISALQRCISGKQRLS